MIVGIVFYLLLYNICTISISVPYEVFVVQIDTYLPFFRALAKYSQKRYLYVYLERKKTDKKKGGSFWLCSILVAARSKDDQ